jgi:hypothetical protein
MGLPGFGTILETAKSVAVLIQKTDNLELLKQALALQTQVHELVDENRLLKARLATREDIEFRENGYWRKDGGGGPFCTPCWDAHDRLVRLHLQVGYNPRCPSCNTVAWQSEVAREPEPEPEPRRRSPWS